ncbi:unnamed protein product [Soboliphyme baturini]|uniref:Uncharacterized protein n=1 Tax=Soboliphyme baturini TaxID=241478 RepID=A0A183J716_9BILA|nr:unnamed protein product [Soboliphyme baturini]
MSLVPDSDQCNNEADEVAALKQSVVQLNEKLIDVVQRVVRLEQAQAQERSFLWNSSTTTTNAAGDSDGSDKIGGDQATSPCKHCLNISASMNANLSGGLQNGDSQIRSSMYRPLSGRESQQCINITRKFDDHHLVSD